MTAAGLQWLAGADGPHKPVEQSSMRGRNQQQRRERRSGAGPKQKGDLIRQRRLKPPIYAGFYEASSSKTKIESFKY